MCKRSVYTFLCLLVCGVANAQLLTVAPAFPKDNATVTITIDCTKGNQGLLNYGNTNDVFVHVGVITNLSSNNGDWKYVKFSWPGTDPAAKATLTTTNKYQYTINNIRTFFGVPAGETILRIAILFRNGAGTQVQRIANTSIDQGNMYVRVYDDNLATQFVQPVFDPRFIPVADLINKQVNDPVEIRYLSNKPATLKLFFNGTEVTTTDNVTETIFTATITTTGNQQIVGRVIDGATIKSDTINFYVAPPVNVQPLPAGVRDGINYEAGNTSAVLVLRAPGKTKVTLIGDFNNWSATTGHQLNKTPDGQYF